MSQVNYLDTLHEQNAEILSQLGELNKLIRSLDAIGMDTLSTKLWSIYQGILSANNTLLESYGKELHADFVDSQRVIGQTLSTLLKGATNDTP